ncbi:MAG: DEAD/DEAH box helicase family protein [Candidatus Aenigmarchaeota archaeon]|nr:DEAD/DEAH box helicase family protein [Candidatus Aenigmarchaeota archaeon]
MPNVILTSYGGYIETTPLANLLGVENFLIFKKKFIVKKLQPSKKFAYCVMETCNLLTNVQIGGKAFMRIPRGALWKMKDELGKIKIEPQAAVPIEAKTLIFPKGYEIYDWQKDTINYIVKKFYTDPATQLSSCTYVDEPGRGKTIICIGLLQILKQKTLIVVPNTGIMIQWKDSLQEWFPDAQIGEFYGKCKDTFESYDIIVGVINSVLKKPPSKNLYGLLIVDESHLCATKARSLLFQKSITRYNIGITATPDDNLYGMDKIVHAHLGEIVYADKIPIPTQIENKGQDWNTEVAIVNYSGAPEYTRMTLTKDDNIDISGIIGQLADDPIRSQFIVNLAKKLYEDPDRYIYIMTDRRNHIENLYNLFLAENIKAITPDLQGPSDLELGRLRGGVTREETQNAIQNARIIICTYAFTGVGISIKKMNTLIMATPRRNNMKQITGRIYRKGSDPNVARKIFDICDTKTILRYQIRDRKYEYRRRCAKMSTIDAYFDKPNLFD